MGLLGDSGVDVGGSVSSSVEEVKGYSDRVDLGRGTDDDLAGELLEKVDSLDERLASLESRQEDLVDRVQEAELDSVVDDGEIKDKVESLSNQLNDDSSGLGERLSLLESGLDRLESSLEVDSEELRESIIEEAEGIDKNQLNWIEERLDRLEQRLKDAEIEDKVGKEELKQEIQSVSEEPGDSEKVLKLEQRVEELEEESKNSFVSREEFEELESHVEELSKLLLQHADKK